MAEGEIFGEEDVLANTPRRFSAKCVSPKGELLVFPSHEFLRLIKTEDLR